MEEKVKRANFIAATKHEEGKERFHLLRREKLDFLHEPRPLFVGAQHKMSTGIGRVAKLVDLEIPTKMFSLVVKHQDRCL